MVQGFFKGCKKWRSKCWNLRIIVPIHKKYCWFCNKFPNIFVINPLKWHFITFPIIFQPKCWQFVLCQWIIVGVNPSLLLYQMSLINEHNIYICPLILAFYRKTLTLRLFVLILQFNVSAHCQISASKAKFLCTALSACFPWVLSQRISHKHCSYFQVFHCSGESPRRQLLITANQRQLQQKEKYLAHLCRCHSEQSCFCLL